MGEIRRPEDIISGRGKPPSDLTPRPIPRPITPRKLDDVIQELKLLKDEIEKIKRILRTHGIAIE